jgi:ribosomal 50S subunit-recycling heat shock protein
MRLDKFLKVTQLIKRRTVAQEATKEGFIYINNKKAKPSTAVKQNDIILMDMWNYKKEIKVISVPEKNTVKKQDLDKYIEILNYETKNTELY